MNNIQSRKTKILNRVQNKLSLSDKRLSNVFETTEIVYKPFEIKNKSLGWKLFESWPSSILSYCNIKIIKVLKIKSSLNDINENNEIINNEEIIWSAKTISDDKDDNNRNSFKSPESNLSENITISSSSSSKKSEKDADYNAYIIQV